MKGNPGFIERDSGRQSFCQRSLVLLRGKGLGPARGFDGLGVTAHFGVGGGQRVQDRGFPSAGQLERPLRKPNGLSAVAGRCLGAVASNPGRLIQNGQIIRLQLETFAPVGKRLRDFPRR